MAYNANIPQAPDILSDSQEDLLNNFIQLSTAWNIDHVPYNSAIQGQHNKVTLPPQAAIPVFAGTTGGIFAKPCVAPYPATGNTEVWISKEGSTTTIPITAAGYEDNGWAYLPSGILLKWGTATVNALNFTVVYPDDVGVAIPRFLQVFNVTVSAFGTFGVQTAAILLAGTIDENGFGVNLINIQTGALVNGNISYFSIGYPAQT